MFPFKRTGFGPRHWSWNWLEASVTPALLVWIPCTSCRDWLPGKKIQSKPRPRVWCHLSNLTYPIPRGPFKPYLPAPYYTRDSSIRNSTVGVIDGAVSSNSLLFFFGPAILCTSALPFTVPLCYCFTRLQRWPLTTARRTQCSDATRMRDATPANANSVIVLSTFFFILSFFFKGGLHGASVGACIRLRLGGSLKAAFSPDTHTHRKRGGETIVPAETMGAAGRHAALRTWMARLWDVCGSVARGLRPKAPFPAPHNEPAQGRDS